MLIYIIAYIVIKINVYIQSFLFFCDRHNVITGLLLLCDKITP